MSTSVFPTLPGRTWPVHRSPEWRNQGQENVSGKETVIGYWSYPRYTWELGFEFLRSASAYAEFQALEGFFNQMKGRLDTFLYDDIDDDVVAAQALGVGDGVKTAFQLQRTLGGATMPVLAPHTISAVKLAGVTQGGGAYSVSVWGAAVPGVVTFTAPPGNGVAVTADFSYYFPCRFADDKIDFEKFVTQIFAANKVTFRSVK